MASTPSIKQIAKAAVNDAKVVVKNAPQKVIANQADKVKAKANAKIAGNNAQLSTNPRAPINKPAASKNATAYNKQVARRAELARQEQKIEKDFYGKGNNERLNEYVAMLQQRTNAKIAVAKAWAAMDPDEQEIARGEWQASSSNPEAIMHQKLGTNDAPSSPASPDIPDDTEQTTGDDVDDEEVVG